MSVSVNNLWTSLRQNVDKINLIHLLFSGLVISLHLELFLHKVKTLFVDECWKRRTDQSVPKKLIMVNSGKGI